uniref:GRIP and coiled-coil domain-containing protein 1 n=1 Tax=Parasteatoda tepidariorum TaxID=114398 RepID=A0A2L2Y874_PARTP
MEKKNKRELLSIIEDQDKNLLKYKSRLHDIIGSYKNLLAEKETLQNSIKTLTEASVVISTDETSENNENDLSSEKKNELCIQNLKSSLGALTIERARIENELKTDRKKILQQKEDLEKKLVDSENKYFLEKEKCDKLIVELRRKISDQQRERDKEQQDHVLMLKELQNVLANERAMKEKLEQQISELLQKFSGKLSEKKITEYERTFDDLRAELKSTRENLNAARNEVKKKEILILKMQEEIHEMKSQYQSKINEEKLRADTAEEKLGMLVFVKEERIANLESRVSELSCIIGDHDKIKLQDQITIEKLKARISQLQNECAAFSSHISTDDSKLLEFRQFTEVKDTVQRPRTHSEPLYVNTDNSHTEENLHLHCLVEISELKKELEQYKAKCESVLRERYNKSSAALLSDAKAGKEIKELKSKVAHMQDQLQSCKSQLKLNEEYHSKITSNLEKACEDLKLIHKQEIVQIEASGKAHLIELEHQIQKQRERTLLLLEEKDKEIGHLKSSFLSSFIQKEKKPDGDVAEHVELSAIDQEAATNILSHSLISSKKDGHILHYVQELARKDVEISNLRQSRIQSESNVRKLEQALSTIKEKYFDEVDALKSRIKLLESTQDQEGTNVEYLKNVVLRFLKCNDYNSRKHMINAIATVLHFTTNEIQDVKGYI